MLIHRLLMPIRRFLPLAAVLIAAACSETAPLPTDMAPGSPLLSHSPSHPGEPLYELTLAAVDMTGRATLATDCDPWDDHIIVDEWNQSLRAGGAGKMDPDGAVLDDDRFELLFTPDAAAEVVFGAGPVCLGNVRPQGDWRDDLIISYSPRRGNRNPATVSVQWWFAQGDYRYQLTVSSEVDRMRWDQITGGETVEVQGPYTLTNVTEDQGWFTAAEGSIGFAFTATALESDGDENGDDEPEPGCPHRNPNHPSCR